MADETAEKAKPPADVPTPVKPGLTLVGVDGKEAFHSPFKDDDSVRSISITGYSGTVEYVLGEADTAVKIVLQKRLKAENASPAKESSTSKAK